MSKAKPIVLQIGQRRRRVTHEARVYIDGQVVGQINHPDQITDSMRAHGVTDSDLKKVLCGIRHAVRFRCMGEVAIIGYQLRAAVA